MASIIDMLNELAHELTSNHNCINQGGCAVIAARVGRHLKRHYPESLPRARFYGNACDASCYTCGQLRSIIIDSDQSPMSKGAWDRLYVGAFAHVVVEFRYKNKWYEFDTDEGVIPPRDMWKAWSKFEGSLTLSETWALAKEDSWNPMFNRSEIPFIEKRIQKAFQSNQQSLGAF